MSTKSKSPKRSKSSSPGKKKSPKKSPKGGKSSPKGKKNVLVAEPGPLFQRPTRPPTPPDPPKGPLLSRVRRQLWYTYANSSTIEYYEPHWNPCFPLLTSWGELWISDPAYRCIRRYYLDQISAKIGPREQLFVTKGEPNMMTELPRTGRIAVLLRCPNAQMTSLVVYDPIELKEENRIDFKFEVEKEPEKEPPPKGQKGQPQQQDDQQQPVLYLEDDSTPIGICANQDILFVLFNPMQKLRAYNPVNLKPYDLKLENAYPDESTCVHLASSCGCVASRDKLFVAATRPPRIQVFYVNRQTILAKIDRIEVTWHAELGLDRLSIGEPFGVQLDSLGMLVVSDSRSGYLRVYNPDKRRPGPWLPSLPHAETCYLGSWKLDAYQPVRPGYFSLSKNGTLCLINRWSNKLLVFSDQTTLRWYDETLLSVDEVPYIRPLIDPLMPIIGLPPPPMLAAIDASKLKRRQSDVSLIPPDDELLTDAIMKRYRRPGDEPEEPVVKKKSPKGKKSKSPSPKSKSPKSKSPKSSKKKSKSKS